MSPAILIMLLKIELQTEYAAIQDASPLVPEMELKTILLTYF